jgi:hypothetical protein
VPNSEASEGTRNSLRELRAEVGADQTLQNLLRALTLNLELRARYRVFEFEATQDGDPQTARLFNRLRVIESEQISELMAGLRVRLNEFDATSSEQLA